VSVTEEARVIETNTRLASFRKVMENMNDQSVRDSNRRCQFFTVISGVSWVTARIFHAACFVFLVTLNLWLLALPVEALNNSWIGFGSGKWEVPANWSLNLAPSNTHSIVINPSSSTTILLDGVTALNVSTLTVSNVGLVLNGSATNTLTIGLGDPGKTFRVLNSVSVGAQGIINLSNSRVEVDGVPHVDSGQRIDEGFFVNGGRVGMTGGELSVPAGVFEVGRTKVGEMNLSNGLLQCVDLNIGSGVFLNGGGIFGSVGTFTLAGSGNVTAQKLLLLSGITGKSSLWIKGGTLTVTTGNVFTVGSQLTVSNGELRTTSLFASPDPSVYESSIKLSGGILSCTNFIFGGTNCAALPPFRRNTMTIDGGTLYVTNATGDAVFQVCGILTMSAGGLVVDRLEITSPCGRFIHTGGSISIGTLILAPALDADADGLPNGWEQANGLDPLNPTGTNGPDGDSDGDGFSNLQEYLAGTSPTNAASALRITGVVRTNDDMLVTWTTIGGHTNIVQVATDLAGGYTNLSPNIILPGTGDVTTNYLDVGGDTNVPARFYRVRLVP